MRKAPQKHRGAQTESMAHAYLLGEGWEVFRNVSDHGSADLVAWKPDESLFLPIDVKSGRSCGLKEKQEKEGVALLWIDADGNVVDFDLQEKRRTRKGDA